MCFKMVWLVVVMWLSGVVAVVVVWCGGGDVVWRW